MGGTSIVVLHRFGTTSALDKSSIAESDDIGAADVFATDLDGRTLTFRREGDVFIDNEAGST